MLATKVNSFSALPSHPTKDNPKHDTAPNPQADQEVWHIQHWFPSLPFQQFQVLFNSLFKVLCIFPSRYLYTIGLPPIFRFRMNLHPTLSCNPKQLDSLTTNTIVTSPRQERESHPLCCPFPRDLVQDPHWFCVFTSQLGTGQACTDSQDDLFPVQSPLLRES